MRFGLDIIQDFPLDDVADWWRICDEAGLEVVGIPDSPAVARELFVSTATCLARTNTVRAMTAVTNPVSRDPSVMAAALLTLDELYPGRIALGIGTGDSALWGVGLKQASVAHLRAYVLAVQALLRGEDATFAGRVFGSTWKRWSPPTRIPIYVACSGPKVLRVASQVADGLIVAMGFGPENIAYVRATIAEACAEVGRAPEQLDVWWHCAVTLAPSVEEARELSLGVNPQWLAMNTMEGKQIPEPVRAPLAQLAAESHDVSTQYSVRGRGAQLVQRARELGIYDWLTSRAPGLWGTPDDVVTRLEELHREGLSNWLFYVGGVDVERADWVRTLAVDVAGRLQGTRPPAR